MNILEPVFVKVLDSTWCPIAAGTWEEIIRYGKAIAMIGKIFKVQQFRYGSNTVLLNDLLFNFSDVQIMTPLFYKGVQIGIGDTVETDDFATGKHVVVDYDKYDGEYRLKIGLSGDVGYNIYLGVVYITSHTPLCSTKVETLEIGGIKYNKEEVEKALKNIKPV